MRGHTPLIAMRRNGSKPANVYLDTNPAVYGRDFPQWHDTDPADARILVEPTDHIETLDLRFLLGCMVSIDGCDARRVRELFCTCQDHGAQRVIAHVVTPAPKGTFDILEILDTEGLLTWQK